MPRSSGSTTMWQSRARTSRARGCGGSWRKRAVLAAGAIERPIVFGNNDRPGVMLAGAVRAYVNRYGVAPGRRAVIFADNDDALRTAEDLAQAGVAVAALIDARQKRRRPARKQRRRKRKPAISLARRSSVCVGGHGVRGVEVSDASGKTERFTCDLVAVSGGWNPTVHLTSHLNGKPQWSDALSALVPGALPPGMRVAGRGVRLVRSRRMPRRRSGSGARGGGRMADSPLRRTSLPPFRTKPARRRARCGKSPAVAARRSSISRTT